MITETDERVNTSIYIDEFKEVAQHAMNYIRINFMDLAEPPRIRGYSNTFNAHKVMKEFDRLISKHGFEIDGRTLKHAHGIGNNNEWEVVDKNIEKVGYFSSVDNMYQGVALSVKVRGERIDGFEICSAGRGC